MRTETIVVPIHDGALTLNLIFTLEFDAYDPMLRPFENIKIHVYDAVRDFLSTEKGKAWLSRNGSFSWADLHALPPEVTERNGFRIKSMTSSTSMFEGKQEIKAN